MNIENLPLTIRKIAQRKIEIMQKDNEILARQLRIAELEWQIARVSIAEIAGRGRENRFSGHQSGDTGEGMGQGAHIPRIAL